MGRPRLETPRTFLVSFRLTESEREVLEALAALDKRGTNEVAYERLQRSLADALTGDSDVAPMIATHRRRSSDKARVTPIRRGGRAR